MSEVVIPPQRQDTLFERIVIELSIFALLGGVIGMTVALGWSLVWLDRQSQLRWHRSEALADQAVITASVPVTDGISAQAVYWPAIRRYLSSLDFRQSCTSNGFDRTTPDSQTLPCIGHGDYRVVRNGDGSYGFFRHGKADNSMTLDLTTDATGEDASWTNVNFVLRAITPNP